MGEVERAMAFLGLTKNHVGIEVVPVDWDEKSGSYIWRNELKVYNPHCSEELRLALEKEVRKIPLYKSRPLVKKK